MPTKLDSKLREERQQLRTFERSLHHPLFAIIDAVHDEHILGQINTHAHNRCSWISSLNS